MIKGETYCAEVLFYLLLVNDQKFRIQRQVGWFWRLLVSGLDRPCPFSRHLAPFRFYERVRGGLLFGFQGFLAVSFCYGQLLWSFFGLCNVLAYLFSGRRNILDHFFFGLRNFRGHFFGLRRVPGYFIFRPCAALGHFPGFRHRWLHCPIRGRITVRFQGLRLPGIRFGRGRRRFCHFHLGRRIDRFFWHIGNFVYGFDGERFAVQLIIFIFAVSSSCRIYTLVRGGSCSWNRSIPYDLAV